MTSTHQPNRAEQGDRQRNSRTLKSAIWMVALIVGFYLIREHWEHVAGNWVYLLLLACPLMHLFHGQGGHGSHGRHDGNVRVTDQSKE